MGASYLSDVYADSELHESIAAVGLVSATVKAGHLVLVDGIGQHRRERRIPRQPRTVKRLVIAAHSGYVSVDAARFLSECGISWCQLHTLTGDIIGTGGPSREDARLLRSQAYAPYEQSGLEITRYLLEVKVKSQAQNLRTIFRASSAARTLEDYAAEMSHAATVSDCMNLEALSAATYFQVWQEQISVPWTPKDMLTLPHHWVVYGGRASLLYDQPQHRNATCPVNASLSYLYKICEAQATLMCQRYGLSPLLGIAHSDSQNRSSFSLDIMETIRSLADSFVLAKLDVGLGVPRCNDKPQYWNRKHFVEEPNGVVRLTSPLAQEYGLRAEQLSRALEPHVQHVAKILAADSGARIPAPRKRKQERIPASTCKTARLRDGISCVDIVPDAIWPQIQSCIPEPPQRRKGRPRETASNRDVVAALAASELLNVPYRSIPVQNVSASTLRARRLEWTWATDGGISAWERIADVLTRTGHLSALLA